MGSLLKRRPMRQPMPAKASGEWVDCQGWQAADALPLRVAQAQPTTQPSAPEVTAPLYVKRPETDAADLAPVPISESTLAAAEKPDRGRLS